MKRLAIILIIMLIGLFSQVPQIQAREKADGNFEWLNTYEISTDFMYGYEPVLTKDNGYLYHDRYSVQKVDETGKIAWKIELGDEESYWLQTFTETEDNGYFFVGSSDGLIVTKVDKNGKTKWNSTLPYYNVNSIMETKDGGCLIDGRGKDDAQLLVKLDKNGKRTWVKDIQELKYVQSDNDKFGFISQTKDGGYILSTGGESKPSYVALVDANGKLKWKNEFKKMNLEIRKGLRTRDNGFLFVGTNYNQAKREHDVYVLKLTENGKEQWSYLSDIHMYNIGTVKETESGNIVIVDYSTNPTQYFVLGTNGSFKLSNILDKNLSNGIDRLTGLEETKDKGLVFFADYWGGLFEENLYIVKYNQEGKLIWEKKFMGGEEYLRGSQFKKTKDGGFIGTAHNTSLQQPKNKSIIFKMNENGDSEWLKTIDGKVMFVPEISEDSLIIGGRLSGNQGFVGRIPLVSKNEKTIKEISSDHQYMIFHSRGESQKIKIHANYSNGKKEDITDDVRWEFIDARLVSVDKGNVTSIAGGRTVMRANYMQHTVDIPVTVSLNQDVVWERTFPSDSSYEGKMIQPTQDGGYVLAARRSSGLYFAKLDKKGFVEWDKEVKSDVEIPRGIIRNTKDKGYILGANIYVKDGPKEFKPLLVIEKLSQKGKIIWSKQYAGIDNFSNLEPTKDGGYIISYGKNIMKLDKQGKVRWSTSFKYGGGVVHETQDGGFIVSGEKVIKIDSQGKEIWSKKYNLPPENLELTQDGGFIIACNQFLTKVDKNGQVEWNKTMEDSSSYFLYIKSIKPTQDGGYIIGSDVEYGFDQDHGVKLFKLDSAGKEQWTTIIGITDDESLDDIQEVKENEYIFLGETYWHKMYIVKVKKEKSQEKLFKDLSASPNNLVMKSGETQSVKILVNFEDGSTLDVTDQSSIMFDFSQVASFSGGELLVGPVSSGEYRITVQFQGMAIEIPIFVTE